MRGWSWVRRVLALPRITGQGQLWQLDNKEIVIDWMGRHCVGLRTLSKTLQWHFSFYKTSQQHPVANAVWSWIWIIHCQMCSFIIMKCKFNIVTVCIWFFIYLLVTFVFYDIFTWSSVFVHMRGLFNNPLKTPNGKMYECHEKKTQVIQSYCKFWLLIKYI